MRNKTTSIHTVQKTTRNNSTYLKTESVPYTQSVIIFTQNFKYKIFTYKRAKI